MGQENLGVSMLVKALVVATEKLRVDAREGTKSKRSTAGSGFKWLRRTPGIGYGLGESHVYLAPDSHERIRGYPLMG